MSAVSSGRTAEPTIYDVARLAGVSASAVSRALNKPGRLNLETERRIRDAAARLGYRGNPMARSLQTGRTGNIALIVSDLTNPVYFDLIRGAERATGQSGLTMVFADLQERVEEERDVARRCATGARREGSGFARSPPRTRRFRAATTRSPLSSRKGTPPS